MKGFVEIEVDSLIPAKWNYKTNDPIKQKTPREAMLQAGFLLVHSTPVIQANVGWVELYEFFMWFPTLAIPKTIFYICVFVK